MNDLGQLGYLCLQATREGQASRAHVHEIIRGLRNQGWKVDLYQPSYANRSGDVALWRRLGEFVSIQVRFIRNMKKWDAVYVRSHVAAFPTVVCARLVAIPMVREVNGTYQDLFLAWPATRFLAGFLRWIMRLQLRWSDIVITVTPQLADWIRREASGAEVFVVPNGADVEHFHPGARHSTELPDRYVLFFGALASWQGIETLLDAVDRPEWPEGIDLVIAGDGALRQMVERASVEKGNVTYLGVVPYAEMPGIVAGSLGALSPQNRGGGRSEKGLYPLKVFETMACGVPVIVTDYPGQADLIRSEDCGLVIPPEDPRALADAVRRLDENPETSAIQGRNGRAAAVKDHSWRQRAADTHEILTQNLGPPDG